MSTVPPRGTDRTEGVNPVTGRYDSVSDAIPDPEPLHGAHQTYAKGEVSSIGELISDITADLSTLLRQEVALAKAEAMQSAGQAGRGAGMLGGAGLAGWFALLFLSIALWWALGSWWDNRSWAAVAVAVLWAVIAAILAATGRNQLKHVKGMPRTVETAKKVPDALKGNEDQS
ncbi:MULTISPECIES: phage holin family protein [Phycicoccus]|uniref:phage holin family protein n=1 Tax=Phycicoccus TaxID=367298 RepID=UPI002CDB8F03|nr:MULTISPECIES: phage holin family protein [Phycicoccus]HPF76603.1 phage holin family protein [Phycicoccus elongatus]HRV58265.1 phage holin family protein [Phycicoccus sp.]